MKWEILQHHEESMLICDEGIPMLEAQNTLFVPQTIRIRNVAARN
jgi:hypothetical protein